MAEQKKLVKKTSELDDFAGYRVKKDDVEQAKAEFSTGVGDFLNINDGETIFRIVPYKKNAKPWVISKVHYLTVGEEKASINCSGEESCLACKHVNFLRACGDSESNAKASELSAKQKFLFAAYSRVEKKIGILPATNILAQRIITPLSANPDLFSIRTGQDFVVCRKKEKGKKYADYGTSYYEGKPKPLISSGAKKGMEESMIADLRAKADKTMLALMKAVPDIEKSASGNSEDRVKSYTDLIKKILDYGAFLRWVKGQASEPDEAQEEKEEKEESLDAYDTGSVEEDDGFDMAGSDDGDLSSDDGPADSDDLDVDAAIDSLDIE